MQRQFEAAVFNQEPLSYCTQSLYLLTLRVKELTSHDKTESDSKSSEESSISDKTKACDESSKAEEEPQNHMAYEFFEPKVSAPINSKLKANLRAKFEMNQINRGRKPYNRHSAIL